MFDLLLIVKVDDFGLLEKFFDEAGLIDWFRKGLGLFGSVVENILQFQHDILGELGVGLFFDLA